MPIWVCRTGTYGEFADTFYKNKCICLTRSEFEDDITKMGKDDVLSLLYKRRENAARQTVSNIWSQVDIFANRMQIGDIVIIPKKRSMLFSVAIIESEYMYQKTENFPLKHIRKINIIANDIDSSDFPIDISRSMGAFRAIFSIRQEDRFLLELQTKGVMISDEI